MSETPVNQSVERAVRLLGFFSADEPELTLPPLSERLGTSRATTHRYTVALRQVGLLRYDAAHSSDLVRSLRVFLELNRSWKDAATALHVHKQTLVYRMRRVEELTGRRLADTGALADLWLALRAAEWSGALPAD